MSDATVLLAAVGRGDSKATGELLELVYDELRHLAAARMAQQGAQPNTSADCPGARGLVAVCESQEPDLQE